MNGLQEVVLILEIGGGNILKLQNVDVVYGDFRAVNGFSMEAQKGEAVGITGKNGAGKTSILRGIVGMADIQGKILFQGRESSGLPLHLLSSGKIGYLPQEKRIFGELSALENLKIIPTNQSLTTVKDRVLSWFPELEGHLDQPGTSLSGGEQVMLALGRTLIPDPDLLLLDEPTEGLMPQLENRLLDVLKRRKLGEGCIIVAEQNLTFVENLCSKAYRLLNQGRDTKVKYFP